MEQFSRQNRRAIQKGNAPFSLPEYQSKSGKRGRFEIHHVIEIQNGGAVYDIDNLRINTVKNHIRIHSNEK